MTTDANAPLAPDDRRRSVRAGIAVAAAVLAALLFWFGRSAWGGWWISETSPAHDTLQISTIYSRWAVQVQDGHLPLWFPEFAGGTPVHSGWMFGLLYPPLLLFTLLPADLAWTWLAILHIVFGAVGMYAWFLEERRDEAAAATAAIVFALSGYVLGRMFGGHINLLMPFVWVPWVLRATLRTSRGERGAIAVLGLCAGVGLLAGHVQIWFYAGPLAAAYGLFEATRRRDPRAVLRLVGGALIALAISAIQWVPAWELFVVSGHPAEGSDLVQACSAPLSALAAQLAPRFASFDPIYGHEHLGLAGPLAVVAALLAWRTRDVQRWFWFAALALSLVLATGLHNAAGEALNALPPFRFGRTPGRALLVVVLAAGMLAGHCVADWFGGRSARIRALVPLAFLASALALGMPSPELVRSDFRDYDWLAPVPADVRAHRLHPGGVSRVPYLEIAGARTLRDVNTLDTPGFKALERAPQSVVAWWFDVIGKIEIPWTTTPRDAAETAAVVARGRFVQFDAGGPFHVFDRAESLSDADALQRMRRGERALFLADGESADLPGAHADPSAVRMERVAPDRIDLTIDESRGPFAGWILVSEKWYPGWETTRPAARVVRANAAFLAVRIDAGGSGNVTLAYRPWWRVPVLLASVAALLGAVAAALMARRSRIARA